jgi:hypothetical protein
MATEKDLRRLALALDGTAEAQHFDRTANFKFTPDEQALKCTVAPEALAPVPSAWGQQGWTTATLSALSTGELKAALETAYAHALAKPKRRPTKGKKD